MSENDEDLELQALERQLDDAFETTRPRPAFEDELWLRMQSSRPAPRRLREALAGFWQGIRAVPAVPATATALVLIVAIGVGIVALNGPGHSGGSETSTAQSRAAAPAAGQSLSGSFGRLPAPAFNNPKTATAAPPSPAANGADYAGPVRFVWAGTFDLNITSAPVYRYREPSPGEADQFAAALGAVLRDRPSGFLGSYSSSDYTLKVRGTVASPSSSPAYFIFSGLNLPAIDAVGGPQAMADIFLAEHSLQPQWLYTVGVDSSGDLTKVVYQRQFVVPGYGPAYFLDFNANRYGLEVDLNGNRPVIVSGVLPVSMDIANYKIVSAGDAIQAAMASAPAAAADTASPLPSARLDHAELVYVLVPAGDHSFYEPAILFTGTLETGGKSYTTHVLVSAVDPSQRTP